MPDTAIVDTLRIKRDELEALIAARENEIEAIRSDLIHVNATLRLFELNGAAASAPLHAPQLMRVKRGEIGKICMAALANAQEGLDTRELAKKVIQAKGLDDRDPVLRKTVALKVISTLAGRLRSGEIRDGGRRKGVRIWIGSQRPTATWDDPLSARAVSLPSGSKTCDLYDTPGPSSARKA